MKVRVVDGNAEPLTSWVMVHELGGRHLVPFELVFQDLAFNRAGLLELELEVEP